MKRVSILEPSALLTICIGCVAGAGTAHAAVAAQGGTYQGGSLQGGTYQGGTYQGGTYRAARREGSTRRDGWLEGDHLVGVLALPTTNRAALVAVTDIRGDAVTATAWDFAAASRYEVTLHPGDLVGFTWWGRICNRGRGCRPLTYRVVSVGVDTRQNTMPDYPSNADVWRYEVEYTDRRDPNGGGWSNVCGTSGGDERRGLFVNGRWRADGTWNRMGYTFSCPAGVIAKCVRAWGYKPWKSLDHAEFGRVSLLPLHLACVRAARADYCGDGFSHTRDGTFIDIADRYGFNVHERIAGFTDEAAFSPVGADWVDAPRWPTGRQRGHRWMFASCSLPTAASDVQPLLFVRSATHGRHARHAHVAPGD